MLLSITTDEAGRYLCELADGPRARDRDRVQRARCRRRPAGRRSRTPGTPGSASRCWVEQGGEYRWMFRRVDDRLTVVVLWSSGTITGWQHVFRGECGFEAFVAQAREAVGRVAAAGA